MSDDTIICRCEEIRLSDIKRAVAEGARDIDGVKRRTRACMGFCQGRTCQRLVAGIIASELGIKPGDVALMTARPPARALMLSTLLTEEGNRDD